MIVVAKLTLFILWLMAFLLTCLVMGIAFPLVVLFEKFQTVMSDPSM